MNALNKLLDKAKEVCGRDSDAAVAERLHVSRNSVSVWRRGGKITDEHLEALVAIVQSAGVDPAVMLDVRTEQASTPAGRRAWATLRERLSAAAAVVALVVLAVHAGAHEGLQAALPGLFITGSSIHYAKYAMHAARVRARWVWLWFKSCLPRRSPRETEIAA